MFHEIYRRVGSYCIVRVWGRGDIYWRNRDIRDGTRR